MTKTFTFKVIMILISLIFLVIGIKCSFWLMNQMSTLLFHLGLVLLAGIVLSYAEVLFRLFYKQKTKQK